jgi:hypothetical protein
MPGALICSHGRETDRAKVLCMGEVWLVIPN